MRRPEQRTYIIPYTLIYRLILGLSAEVHKTLKDLSTNKDETFSDIIAKLADYYKKGHPKK
jgi:galactose-1-phosphate uridylyltransferase